MNKTKIEWCDYVWNPVIGCKRGCSYCYAKKINDRFHFIKDYSIPEWREKSFMKSMPKKPSKIFVNSMSDICYWNIEWMDAVLKVIEKHPQHTFMFLTKGGENVYTAFNFPKNCWLGITYQKSWTMNICSENWDNKKYISIEPLLEEINGNDIGKVWDLVIIGGLTPKPTHKKEWIEKIIRHCQNYGISYFLKNNLNYKRK